MARDKLLVSRDRELLAVFLKKSWRLYDKVTVFLSQFEQHVCTYNSNYFFVRFGLSQDTANASLWSTDYANAFNFHYFMVLISLNFLHAVLLVRQFLFCRRLDSIIRLRIVYEPRVWQEIHTGSSYA
jgi:hypothetical protein